ncbi:MAG: NAD(P)/FAD-dependent oxidoreductase [Microbacterium arborescens]
MSADLDAVVVGSGPNGLAAAVTLARAGLRVAVFEAHDHLGGGAASGELTRPGFVHDLCSAIHPMAFESRFFREFGLRRRVEFAVPEASYAHPLDDGAAIAYRDLDRTADELGRDGHAYRRLMAPLVERVRGVADLTGGSLLRVPGDPVAAAWFAARTLEQGTRAAGVRFREDAAPALVSGVAAHTILRLPSLPAAGAGLALATYGHAQGWPVPVGGSGAIVAAMVDDIRAHGGEIVVGHRIRSLDELPPARAVVLDVTPRALVGIAGDRMPAGYRRRIERFRYGGAVAKVDFALSDPVPWRDPRVASSATVHVGGTRPEIFASENAVLAGRLPDSPYVLAAQPSLFDPSRAPAGRHTLWAYTHVPAGSAVDRSEAVIAQIERFAPGFRDTIIASHSETAVQVAARNPNYPGGDISAGTPSLRQLVARPVLSREPWRTPIGGVYLCSASTSPGPGVHGLGGWWAALSALRHEFGDRALPDLSPRS